MIRIKSTARFTIALIILIGIFSCGPTTSEDNSTDSTTIPNSPLDTQVISSAETKQPNSDDTKLKKDCTISGKRLEDNDFRVPNSTLLVSILADSTTTDPEFGESYRVFQVYDLATCSIKYRETLPINFSPDYPYYLSPESYSQDQQVICTPGYDLLYCFDLKNMKALPKMKPTANMNTSVDAQSGMPVGVISLDNYLIGYAINMGGYAFDISDKNKPKGIAPAAAYASPDEEVNTLFFLPENEETYHAIMTIIDDEGRLRAEDVFSKSIKVNPTLPANIRNNRFLVFKDQLSDQQLAIDMEAQEAVGLPADISSKPVKDILKWLKSR